MRNLSVWARAHFSIHHTFPAPNAAEVRESYLERYPEQYRQFRAALPRIVRPCSEPARSPLRIGVVGPSTGEEMASLLAAVVNESARLLDFIAGGGGLPSIEIVGLERDLGRLRAATERLAGLSPLAVRKSLMISSGPYRAQVAATMTALNAEPAWSKRRFHVHHGDAFTLEGLRLLASCNAVFFNAVGLSSAPRFVLGALAETFANCMVFGTFHPDQIPDWVRARSHVFDVSLSPSGKLGFVVATPSAWACPVRDAIVVRCSGCVDEPDLPPVARNGW